MKKVIRLICIVFLISILSTVYTSAETLHSPLDLYKHSLAELMGSLKTIVDQTEKHTDYQITEEVERIKNETYVLLNRESNQAIKGIEQYQIIIQKQITMIDKEAAFNKIRSYETEKTAIMKEEINNEVTDYLSEILSDR